MKVFVYIYSHKYLCTQYHVNHNIMKLWLRAEKQNQADKQSQYNTEPIHICFVYKKSFKEEVKRKGCLDICRRRWFKTLLLQFISIEPKWLLKNRKINVKSMVEPANIFPKINYTQCVCQNQ